MTIWLIVILCCFLFSLNIYLGIKLYKFSLLIIDIEDAIEESLDILDERYKKINEILQIPIFFDSIEVRQVIAEIRKCHDAILIIANKLTNDIEVKNKEDANAIEAKEENVQNPK